MRPQKGRGIVISGGIVEVAELRRGTNPQSIARALLCCLSVNSASLGPDRLCCCLLNSLDGVGGCLVSGLQPGMNGLEDIPRVGRILRTPGAHPNLKEEPCGDSRRRLSGGAKLCSLFSAPVRHFQRTSMEDGRPARLGSSTGVLPNSPPATLNHVGTAALGCPMERSSARCSDTSVRHLQKNFGGGRASPPAQVRALACFQIPLPPLQTTWGWRPRPPGRAQLRNSWDCHPGRARLRSEGSGAPREAPTGA
jgi:hypothetical protein